MEYETLELNFLEELSMLVALGLVLIPNKLLLVKLDVAALTEAENRPVPFVCGEWLHAILKSLIFWLSSMF